MKSDKLQFVAHPSEGPALIGYDKLKFVGQRLQLLG